MGAEDEKSHIMGRRLLTRVVGASTCREEEQDAAGAESGSDVGAGRLDARGEHREGRLVAHAVAGEG